MFYLCEVTERNWENRIWIIVQFKNIDILKTFLNRYCKIATSFRIYVQKERFMPFPTLNNSVLVLL